jgi:DHA1 family tetracycline resistance protein-like MFS transporter
MTQETAEPAPGGRRASFGFIFALALMNSVSFGLMIPILPNLIKSFTGGDTASASEWNALFAATWGLMQFWPTAMGAGPCCCSPCSGWRSTSCSWPSRRA